MDDADEAAVFAEGAERMHRFVGIVKASPGEIRGFGRDDHLVEALIRFP
ncbi:hypothetical protein GGE66_003982 [Rhizobium leguminosarum]|uniref:Uncharacterized protein n=1 Tax=Rhizobium leguminosarum TaxID=384 RepID=A0A7W9ZUC2_RHILE|nr:hypothetical protein [Rhizobium leguminosarum]